MNLYPGQRYFWKHNKNIRHCEQLALLHRLGSAVFIISFAAMLILCVSLVLGCGPQKLPAKSHLGPPHTECFPGPDGDCVIVQSIIHDNGKAELSPLGCILQKAKILWIFNWGGAECAAKKPNTKTDQPVQKDAAVVLPH